MTNLPSALYNSLDRDLPVLLLPVRLEMRFGTRPATTSNGATVQLPVLRLRIYPDDISIDDHQQGLTEAEVMAGRAYAKALADHAAAEPLVAETQKQSHWELLTRRVGTHRATYVAEMTRNPAVDPPRRAKATAATAELLPDYWAVTGWVGDTRVFEVLSSRIRHPLAVGPMPRADGQPVIDPESPLPLDEGSRWLADYEEAVAAGMAVTIDLVTSDAFAEPGRDLPLAMTSSIEQIFVFGIREPLPEGIEAKKEKAEKEANLFGQLIHRHRALHGAGFLKQGSPTNNLGNRPTEWSTQPNPYSVKPIPPTGDLPAGAGVLRGFGNNAQATEAALGLTPGTLNALENSALKEQLYARLMNEALFPVTWGELIGTLFVPSVVDVTTDEAAITTLEQARSFARSHMLDFVRARGPLPVLRVGKQPYGILPITDPSNWVQQSGETDHIGGLSTLLDNLRPYWKYAAENKEKLTSELTAIDRLIDVLGHGPVPHPAGYGIRTVTGEFASVEYKRSFQYELHHNAGDPNVVIDTVHESTKRGIFRRFIGGIPDLPNRSLFYGLTMQEPDLLSRPIAQTNKGGFGPKEYLKRLGGAEPDNNEASRDLLYQLIRRSLRLAVEQSIFTLIRKRADWDQFRVELMNRPVEMYDVAEATQPSVNTVFATQLTQLGAPVESIAEEFRNHSLFEIATEPRLRDQWQSQEQKVIAQGKQDNPAWPLWIGTQEFLDTRDAVRQLAEAALRDGDYERLLGETLALCATRFDAWQTSIATQRLDLLRSRRPTGLQIGAYGWLLNLPPYPKYDLRLIPVNDIDHGRSLVIVALDGAADLHIRIFDASGTKVIDKGKAELVDLPDLTVAAFKQRLTPFPSQSDLSQAEQWELIDIARAIAGHKPLHYQEPLVDRSTADDPLVLPVRQVGFVHAPSLAQAETAAVLRAAELSHGGEAGSSVARLDLTSARMRTAIWVLEAVHNGQPLGAVLGYRLERALHDNGLSDIVDDIRAAFPQRGAPHPRKADGPDVQIVPREVVDGERAWSAWNSKRKDVQGDIDARVREDINALDHLFQKLKEGQDRTSSLETVMRGLDVTVESVADLLVAEGVHQIVSGNSGKAAATLNAVAYGDPPPSDFDVLRSPRNGVVLTNRIVLALQETTPVQGWDATTPRARLSPRLEAWAGRLLGDPSRWVVGIVVKRDKVLEQVKQVTLADVPGLSALDVIYEATTMSGAQSILADRLVATADLTDAHVAQITPPAEGKMGWTQLDAVAGAVRDLIGASRPLTAQDLLRPDEPPLSRGYDLRLMSVNAIDELDSAIDEIKDKCRSLVIIALVGADLHLRIFDASGIKVLDKAENELNSGATLTALKQQLNPFPEESSILDADKLAFIANATAVANHPLNELIPASEILRAKAALFALLAEFNSATEELDTAQAALFAELETRKEALWSARSSTASSKLKPFGVNGDTQSNDLDYDSFVNRAKELVAFSQRQLEAFVAARQPQERRDDLRAAMDALRDEVTNIEQTMRSTLDHAVVERTRTALAKLVPFAVVGAAQPKSLEPERLVEQAGTVVAKVRRVLDDTRHVLNPKFDTVFIAELRQANYELATELERALKESPNPDEPLTKASVARILSALKILEQLGVVSAVQLEEADRETFITQASAAVAAAKQILDDARRLATLALETFISELTLVYRELLAAADMASVRTALTKLVPFGVGAAQLKTLNSEKFKDTAEEAGEEAKQMLDDVSRMGFDRLLTAARTLLGPATMLTPLLSAADHLQQNPVPVDNRAQATEQWLTRLGRVRSALAALEDVRMFCTALELPSLPLHVTQLPLVPEDGWLGGTLRQKGAKYLVTVSSAFINQLRDSEPLADELKVQLAAKLREQFHANDGILNQTHVKKVEVDAESKWLIIDGETEYEVRRESDTEGEQDTPKVYGVKNVSNPLRQRRLPKQATTHLVMASHGGLDPASALAGLVLDEFSEVIPLESQTTGVGLHYDAPNARPPQSLLLAVHPDPARADLPWSWQMIENMLKETLNLAKLRTVELEHLAPTYIDEYLPAIYARDGMEGMKPLHPLSPAETPLARIEADSAFALANLDIDWTKHG